MSNKRKGLVVLVLLALVLSACGRPHTSGKSSRPRKA